MEYMGDARVSEWHDQLISQQRIGVERKYHQFAGDILKFICVKIVLILLQISLKYVS